MASTGEDVEKLENIYIVLGSVKWCGHYGKKLWKFHKTKL